MGNPNSQDHVPKHQSRWQKAKVAAQLFYQKAMNDNIFDRAASISFQALFSIIPLIAIGYVIFALSGGFEDVSKLLEAWVAQNLAPAASDDVVGYLQTIRKNVDPKAIGIFGVAGFLWAGVSMVSKVEEAMNGLWGLTRTRSFFKRLFLYSGGVVVAPVILGLSFAATSFLASSTDGSQTMSAIFVIPLAVLPWLVTGAFFSFIYWLLPYTDVSKRAALKAGFIAGIGFEILKQGYAFYAANSLGDSIYGSLAVLPVLFLWISLASMVFMFGAELCYFFDMKEQGVLHVARQESHMSFPLLVDIIRRYQKNQTPLSVKKVVAAMKWDQSDIFRHVHYLADIGLLKSPRGHSEGDECYQATESNFEVALDKLLHNINSIKYEQLELPPPQQMPGQSVETRAKAAKESGRTLVDRILSPWGAQRKPQTQ